MDGVTGHVNTDTSRKLFQSETKCLGQGTLYERYVIVIMSICELVSVNMVENDFSLVSVSSVSRSILEVNRLGSRLHGR